jgi:glutathione S-transferase
LRRLGLPVLEHPCDVFNDPPELLAINPLGLIPSLKTPQGEGLFDSAAILEYLDDLSGLIWPKALPDRTHVRQASFLASGIMQSAVSYLQETAMHEVPSPTWAHDHFQTLDRSILFAMNVSESLWMRGDELTQAGWDLAVALEYVEFRVPALKERANHPLLQRILDRANQSPDFRETKPRL